MDNVFLVCFFVGLFFTAASAILAGIFGGHHEGAGADTDVDVGDIDIGDIDVGDIDVGGIDVGDVDVGDIDVGDLDAGDADFSMGHDFDHSVAEAGGGGHVEVGLGDAFPGLSPWSPTVLCSFLTTFGGVGFLSMELGSYGIPSSILFGMLAGFGIAGSVFYLMNKLFGALQASSEVCVANLRGREATVITPIPEKGVGEITYEARGTRHSAPARTKNGKPVGRGARVKIVRIVGSFYYVKPV